MKKTTRFISLLLSIIMLLSITAGINLSAYAATSHTQQEAVNWANSHVGKALDYDGAYGAQCVDLIYYYYNYLGVSPQGGNANAYMSNSLPSGWKRVKYTSGMVPQPGDIAVWKTNISGVTGSYGHVSIVISAHSSTFVTVQQNSSGRQYCTKDSDRKNSWLDCVIRPDFKTTVTNPTVTVKGSSNVTKNSARIDFTANNPSKVTINRVGVEIRKKGESSWTITKSEAMNKDYTNAASVPMWWTVGPGSNFEINKSLEEGITYEYRAYVVYNGKNYYSSTSTFTTKGSSTYTISYNANGGSGAPASQAKNNGVTLILSSTRPTRAGYAFLGWSTSSTATTATYQPGGSYTANSNATLYAVWSKIGTVSNVQVSALSTTGAKLTWNSVSGASGYEIQYLLNGQWTTMCEMAKNSKIFSQLTENRLYTMRVRAFKTVNGTKTYSNNWSDPISFTTYLTVNRISYSNINSKGATLNINSVKNATGYALQFVSNGVWKDLGDITANSRVFSSLASSTKYTFRVRAYAVVNGKKIYSSNWSAPYSFTTSADAAKLPAVQNFKAVNITKSGATLTFDKVSGADGYELQYISNGTWKKFGDITSNSRVFSSLASGTSYTFRVRAYAVVNGQKVYSNNYSYAVSFTTLTK